ncbi:helix-turn-helix transcriptional regulator [Mycobacterium sp. CBMA293]|nr:helix-turn-helix transcriptional regulator [Mycolicibacterium sp. CBMA 360]MUL60935.1 helix-turn-helix transcriptional regulator [Mycolicibacterium sp. CBMA 335]MUL71948.1 helix-turn-helix transcriptional regulator [Mycolicibacterium sp. CBMA 311]MUL95876.1 helix-turn-helix transcriptional regulator [Mycolicibacterium sp. CBMA 230]MUM13263.1 helix-turn-helix transcriptional regulator [Mycolicibacterium sp. CBMA 293]MUM31953.1 helix-turn-helix transcriptional regulator [Mycolicibacterium sp.
MRHARCYDRKMHHVALMYDTGEFGERIRTLRREKGLRQDELADRIGVTRMTISRLERGESVSVDTALRALSECGYAIAVAPKFSRLAALDGA